HTSPDEEESGERDRREPEGHEGEATGLEQQVRDDLGGVFGVDPPMAVDREGEEVLRHQLVVIDHPLAGDEVPEDVGITASADNHTEKHDEGRNHDELPGRDTSESVADR